MERTAFGPQTGALLTEALVALALLGLALTGTFGLAEWGSRTHRQARNQEAALAAAERILNQLDGVSFHRLSQLFAAAPAAEEARISSRDGTAPVEWTDWVSALPEGEAAAEIRGFAGGAGSATLADAGVLRIRVTVLWQETEFRRQLVLLGWRF